MPSYGFLITVVVAYLLGAFPTAFVVGKLRNIDITKHGSGNIGGTNAMRVMGLGPGVLVMVADVFKAALPTYIAAHLLPLETWQVMTVALSTVIGHNWSVYIGFRGGKGIACTIGACAVLFPAVLLTGFAVFALTIAITKYVSLGSLVMMTSMPILLGLLGYRLEYILFALCILVIGTYRHRSNIQRLLKGTENKVGRKKCRGD
ncbi:MAG: Glycerol-3-phosphate acyltransferase [Firmicutes bacterium]|nr:Glycerol-3-phosphate acyltransferase [Bacillota bacterium]